MDLGSKPRLLHCFNKICWAFLLASSAPTLLPAQEVYLDKAFQYGRIEFFPSVVNSQQFYYLPLDLSLAKDEKGAPSFFFEKAFDYTAKDNNTLASGNLGVLQLEIVLGVDSLRLDSAWTALQAIVPDAVLMGPIQFDSCTLGVVSSIAHEGSDLLWQTRGVKQPLRQTGDRATISLILNDLGARILWNTFETPTPDLTISLNAVKNGYVTENQHTSPRLMTGSRKFQAYKNISRPEKCRTCFMARLADPQANEPGYQSRTVYLLNEQFSTAQADSTVYSTQFVLRKMHADGYTTMQEMLFLTPPTVKDRLRYFVSYPRNPGDTGEDWLNYEYQLIWKLKNGETKKSGWKKNKQPVVFLGVQVD